MKAASHLIFSVGMQSTLQSLPVLPILHEHRYALNEFRIDSGAKRANSIQRIVTRL
jgi:hypothetical protein